MQRAPTSARRQTVCSRQCNTVQGAAKQGCSPSSPENLPLLEEYNLRRPRAPPNMDRARGKCLLHTRWSLPRSR
eukprot:3887326-Amphidinium_carterae.1